VGLLDKAAARSRPDAAARARPAALEAAARFCAANPLAACFVLERPAREGASLAEEARAMTAAFGTVVPLGAGRTAQCAAERCLVLAPAAMDGALLSHRMTGSLCAERTAFLESADAEAVRAFIEGL
jgi:hypothetical protein